MKQPKLSEEGERLVSELERLAVLADNGSLYNQGTREARLADARAALRAHMAAQQALVENLLADVCYWKGMYNTAEANRKQTLMADYQIMKEKADYEAKKALAAADARIRELEAEREWRPIDTAPKDGTHILANLETRSEQWQETLFWDGAEEGWWSVRKGDYIEYEVTHWMLLPQPPNRARA